MQFAVFSCRMGMVGHCRHPNRKIQVQCSSQRMLEGYTALHGACEIGKLTVVKRLLREKNAVIQSVPLIMV